MKIGEATRDGCASSWKAGLRRLGFLVLWRDHQYGVKWSANGLSRMPYHAGQKDLIPSTATSCVSVSAIPDLNHKTSLGGPVGLCCAGTALDEGAAWPGPTDFTLLD